MINSTRVRKDAYYIRTYSIEFSVTRATHQGYPESLLKFHKFCETFPKSPQLVSISLYCGEKEIKRYTEEEGILDMAKILNSTNFIQKDELVETQKLFCIQRVTKETPPWDNGVESWYVVGKTADSKTIALYFPIDGGKRSLELEEMSNGLYRNPLDFYHNAFLIKLKPRGYPQGAIMINFKNSLNECGACGWTNNTYLLDEVMNLTNPF